MLMRLLGMFLRFAHQEGWLLKLAEHFDPQGPRTVNVEEGRDGVYTP